MSGTLYDFRKWFCFISHFRKGWILPVWQRNICLELLLMTMTKNKKEHMCTYVLKIKQLTHYRHFCFSKWQRKKVTHFHTCHILSIRILFHVFSPLGSSCNFMFCFCFVLFFSGAVFLRQCSVAWTHWGAFQQLHLIPLWLEPGTVLLARINMHGLVGQTRS